MFLTSTTFEPFSAQDFINKIIPNWVSFVVQLSALIVLIIVVIIFAYKPVKRIIEKRQNYILDNIKESETNKAEALTNRLKSEEMVLASSKEAQKIIEEAKKEAMVERSKIIDETSSIVAKMKNDAEIDILRSKEEAKENIRTEMVEVALAASSEILKRNVNEKDNERMTKEFIEEMDK